MNRWIDIHDQLPPLKQPVLGRFENNDMAVVSLTDEDLLLWNLNIDQEWETDCESCPTHWMRLPQFEFDLDAMQAHTADWPDTMLEGA